MVWTPEQALDLIPKSSRSHARRDEGGLNLQKVKGKKKYMREP